MVTVRTKPFAQTQKLMHNQLRNLAGRLLLLTALTTLGLLTATLKTQAQCTGPNCLAKQAANGMLTTGIEVTTAPNQKKSDTCYWVTWGVVEFRGGAQPKLVRSGVKADLGDNAYCSSRLSTGDVKQAFEQAIRSRYQDAKSISVKGVRVSRSPHTARMWRDNALNRLKKQYGVSQSIRVDCLRYLDV